MLDAARMALSFVQGRERADLDTDTQLAFALVKTIEIIGEAASRISGECQNRLPMIPWQDIVGMRNRLIHAYFEINADIVWSALTNDLPALAAQIEAFFEQKT